MGNIPPHSGLLSGLLSGAEGRPTSEVKTEFFPSSPMKFTSKTTVENADMNA